MRFTYADRKGMARHNLVNTDTFSKKEVMAQSGCSATQFEKMVNEGFIVEVGICESWWWDGSYHREMRYRFG